MKILVVGSGGREHAIAWKLAQDSAQPQLFCAPGNAGTALVGSNLALGVTDIEGLTDWCKQEQPDLVVIGPEAPLCAGLTDALEAIDIPVFGPKQSGCRIRGQ